MTHYRKMPVFAGKETAVINEQEVEKAVRYLKKVINAAENANHDGEIAALAAASQGKAATAATLEDLIGREGLKSVLQQITDICVARAAEGARLGPIAKPASDAWARTARAVEKMAHTEDVAVLA
jgi:uncharacterized protein YicC (UPF0701 family)